MGNTEEHTEDVETTVNTVETESTDDNQQTVAQTVPYSRFSKVVAQKNELIAQLESANAELEQLRSSDERRIALEQEVAEWQAKVDELNTGALRTQIAIELNIPQLADRLRGTTEEELREDGKKLVASLPKQQRPVEGMQFSTDTTQMTNKDRVRAVGVNPDFVQYSN